MVWAFRTSVGDEGDLSRRPPTGHGADPPIVPLLRAGLADFERQRRGEQGDGNRKGGGQGEERGYAVHEVLSLFPDDAGNRSTDLKPAGAWGDSLNRAGG